MTAIHEAISRAASERPSHIALVQGTRQESYAALGSRVGQAAAWLRRSIAPGDRVGLMLGNSIDAVVWLYGVAAAGGIAVPIDADAHLRTVGHVLADSGACLAVGSAAILSRQPGLGASAGPRVLAAEDVPTGGGQALAGSAPDPCGTDSDRTACLLYTTGTTGPPKGVMLTHANLLAATANMNAFMRPGPWIVESIPMRLSHSFGFARLRSVFSVGGTAILEEGLAHVGPLFERMRRHGVNALASVPAGFAILLDRYLEPFKAVASSLRLVEIGSAPMPRRQKDLLAACCPNARICMHYGLTEASRAAFLDFEADRASLDSAGKPSPNVAIRVVNERGMVAAAGETGEIQVRGPMVTTGFWRRPDLTRDAFSNGWLRTGDLGWVDGKGYLHLAGRRGDVINLGGLKVAPVEVEDRLSQFDGIADAAVTVAPGDTEGTLVLKALLVMRPEHPVPDPARLRAFCLDGLEPYKVPATFAVVQSLPRTASGKLQRHLLPGAGGVAP